jgi:hypothetical protein
MNQCKIPKVMNYYKLIKKHKCCKQNTKLPAFEFTYKICPNIPDEEETFLK